MRCPDCNKFVSYDEPNVDDVSFSLDENSGEVEVSGTVELPCADCGTALKSMQVDETVDLPEFPDYLQYVPEAKREDEAWLKANVNITYAWATHSDEPSPEQSTSTRKGKAYAGVSASGKLSREVLVKSFDSPSTIERDRHIDVVDWTFECEIPTSDFEEC